MTNEIFRGDDTSAFNNKFLTIELDNPNNLVISKAEIKCGSITRIIEKPIFPIEINLTSKETETLNAENTCYLAVYDELGRKKTCSGSLTFNTKREVV